MPDAFPSISIPYSRLSRLGFGIAMLILGYGGVGMVFGIISADAGERTQQIWIGIVFLACALVCALGFLRMFRAGALPVLVVDAEGIWDKRLTSEPIPWSKITAIEGISPGFMERLVMPGSQAGKILLNISPEAWNDIPFTAPHVGPLHNWLLAGTNKLRIYHGTIDARFPLLMDRLIDAERAAQGS